MHEISQEAAKVLDSRYFICELDGSGQPHILIKVPDLEKAAEAELGIELTRGEDDEVVLSVLLYDIPTEPVSYDMSFDTASTPDISFLKALVESVVFKLHPCASIDDAWVVGEPQTLRVPPNILLRLKHYSQSWSPREPAPREPAPKEESKDISPKEVSEDLSPRESGPLFSLMESADAEEAIAEEELKVAASSSRSGDVRENVIKKLKEQNQNLRSQLRAKDSRIIELEDELSDIKSKKRWWKPL